MADFLTKLASRTLGLAPMAEPIVAPMFAPPRVPTPPRAGSDEPPDSSWYLSEPASRGAPVSSADSRSEDRERTTAPRQASDLLPSRPSARVEAAADDVLLVPSKDAPERSLPAGSSAWAADTEPAQPATSPTSLGASDWFSEQPRRFMMPASRDGAADEPLLMPLNPVETPSARLAVAAGRTHVVAVVTPADEAEPPRRADRAPAAASAPAPTPPTIEVTIGRVEVRAAVGPPAPVTRPRVAAPAAPSLSLEEYLRSQHGGRR